MDFLQTTILLSTLLCGLVAGFLLAFTIVVMPGIQTFKDQQFLEAFKVMDAVIQNNQPSFIFVWAGSVLALLAAAGIGFAQLEGMNLGLIIIACAMYLIGVQLPTMTINVPLNNQLQALNLDVLSEPELQEARTNFEPRWIRWNAIRTVVAILTTILLIVVVFRL